MGSLYGWRFAGAGGWEGWDAFGFVGKRFKSRDEFVLVFGSGGMGRRTFGIVVPAPLPAPARERGWFDVCGGSWVACFLGVTVFGGRFGLLRIFFGWI